MSRASIKDKPAPVIDGFLIEIDWDKWMKEHHVKLNDTENPDQRKEHPS